VSGPQDVPPDVLSRLRAICLALPDAYEEQAWEGVRWLVRRRTFAHVLTVQDGRPQAFVRAAGLEPADAPAVVLTFRSASPELEALRAAGPPFFAAPWGPDVVGMLLHAGTDWTEVGELLTESFLVRAPRVLHDAVRAEVVPPRE
jgi:hypothetical protein